MKDFFLGLIATEKIAIYGFVIIVSFCAIQVRGCAESRHKCITSITKNAGDNKYIPSHLIKRIINECHP